MNDAEPAAFEVLCPDREDVFAFDRKEIGIDRKKILTVLFDEPTAHCLACEDGNGMTGYLLTKQALGQVDLEPCVVDGGDMKLAEGLLRSATALIGTHRYKLCVPGNNGRAAEMIRNLGFHEVPGPTRMTWGEPFEERSSMIAMMSPEKG